MPAPSTALKRMTALERAMLELAEAQKETQRELKLLSTEMRDFKEEMSAFKDEMSAFKDEMSAFKEEMSAFKDEVRASNVESNARIEAQRREFNREFGAQANRMGRLVEDMVAPSVSRILRELLGLPSDASIAPCGPRLRLVHPTDRTRMRELDVLAAHGAVFMVVEVKSQLTSESIALFAASLPEIREYLVPLGMKELIGAVASLHVDPSLVALASRLGVVTLGVGDELCEIKSGAGFAPRRF